MVENVEKRRDYIIWCGGQIYNYLNLNDQLLKVGGWALRHAREKLLEPDEQSQLHTSESTWLVAQITGSEVIQMLVIVLIIFVVSNV